MRNEEETESYLVEARAMIERIKEMSEELNLLEKDIVELKKAIKEADKLEIRAKVVEMTRLLSLYDEIILKYRAIYQEWSAGLKKFGLDKKFSEQVDKISKRIIELEEGKNSFDQQIQDAHLIIAEQDLENLNDKI